MARRSFGSVRKINGGRFQARYSAPDGHRYTAPGTFATKTEASAWLARIQASIASGDWEPPAVTAAREKEERLAQQGDLLTFDEWADQWLASLPAQQRSPQTIQTYTYRLKRVRKEFGTLPIAHITARHVTSWHATLWQESGPGVARPLYMTLSSCMQAAKKAGYISESPCQVPNASTHQPVKDPERVQVASPEQVRDLAAAMPAELKIAVLLAAWCQYREGELLGSQRRDFDLKKGTYIIRRQAQSLTGEGMTFGPPKSKAGIRSGAIPASLIPALKEHLDRYAAPGPQGLLFPRASDQSIPIHDNTLRSHWNKAREAVGMPSFVFHDLRHTGLTRFAQQGATTAELLERGGHTSIAVALSYQHATAERDRALTEQMDKEVLI